MGPSPRGKIFGAYQGGEPIVLHYLGHGGRELYESEPLLKFLLGD
jgi:hypothetical protein